MGWIKKQADTRCSTCFPTPRKVPIDATVSVGDIWECDECHQQWIVARREQDQRDRQWWAMWDKI